MTCMTMTLPEEKVQKIFSGCQMALWKENVSVRELLRLIGMMLATALVVLPAQLHYRELQEQKIRQLKVAQSFEVTVPLIGDRDAAVNNDAQEMEWTTDSSPPQ